MAIFPTITSSTSVFNNGAGAAFDSDSPAADTLNVAVGGYLVARTMRQSSSPTPAPGR